MTTSVAAAALDSRSAPLDSAQVSPDGTPRFQIPAQPEHPDWSDAVAIEAAGGVDAEFRVFLDEQLATGDVVLDLAPGFGFVALGAATAPGGVATVLLDGLDDDRLAALQDAAANAGAWVEGIDHAPWTALPEQIDVRLDADGRVFIRCHGAQLADATYALQPLFDAGRVTALCVSDGGSAEQWPALRALFQAVGFRACTLVEQEGEALLVPLDDASGTAIIAVSSALLDSPSPESPSPSEAQAPDGHRRAPAWDPMREGFSFIAPHARTGYGVVGAHLLKALQARELPVAFFPLGALDRTLTDNPALDLALERQGTFASTAPSVRLSQQFDLAMHVGRGPRVGFTIFETDVFTGHELHHLRSQDAIVVCSAWARDVCVANGLPADRVHVVPLGVDRLVFNEAVVPSRRWEETVFLQVGKLEPRKGQLELLRAFEDAFTPQDDVRLVLACHNPFMRRDAFDLALRPFRSSPMAKRITLLTSELESAHDVAALMASAHCGVFPSRAEGWNLEALEMLSMGKPVVATAATAHTAFLTADNAQLIAVDSMEPALGGRLPGQWPAWGATQHEALVAALRDVHVRRSSEQLPLNTAGIATATSHSWHASATALLDALTRLA